VREFLRRIFFLSVTAQTEKEGYSDGNNETTRKQHVIDLPMRDERVCVKKSRQQSRGSNA